MLGMIRHSLPPVTLAAATLTAITWGPAAAALAAVPQKPPAACAGHYNPYEKSEQFLTACGDHIYPLLTVTSLPGGGKAYTYDVEGATTVYKVPPAGFNARTASDAMLREYGLPTRSDAKQYKVGWSDLAGNLKAVTPPSHLVGITARAGQRVTAASTGDTSCSADEANATCNWSGYSTYRKSSTPAYTHAYGRWVEPSFVDGGCTDHAEVTWAGLGGWSDGVPLAQDGTAHNVSGTVNHQAWSEVLPDQKYMVPQNLFATKGQEFTALVSRISGGFHMFMKNQYTGNTLSYDVASSHYNGGSAEVIIERPSYTNDGGATWYFNELSDFSSITVNSARAITSGSSTYQSVGSFPHHLDNMYNRSGSHLLAAPGPLYDDGKMFYDHWYDCN